MKKYTYVFCSIFFFFLMVGATIFASNVFMDSKYFSEEEVRNLVYIQTESDPNDVSEYKCEKKIDENKKLVYDVSFSDSKGVYQFIIDCKSGQIIKFVKLNQGQSIPETVIS